MEYILVSMSACVCLFTCMPVYGGHKLMMSILTHLHSILFVETGSISKPEAYQLG